MKDAFGDTAADTLYDYTIDSIAWGAFTITAVVQATMASNIVVAFIGIIPALIGAYIWMRHQDDRQKYEDRVLADAKEIQQANSENESLKIRLEHEREMRRIELEHMRAVNPDMVKPGETI